MAGTIEPYKFDAQRKEAYLQELRQGGRRYASARKVGVTPQTVWVHMKDDQEFAAAVNEAEMEANDSVEDAMLKSALDGNVTAQQVWLYNRSPERWQDKRNLNHERDQEYIRVDRVLEMWRGALEAIKKHVQDQASAKIIVADILRLLPVPSAPPMLIEKDSQ